MDKNYKTVFDKIRSILNMETVEEIDETTNVVELEEIVDVVDVVELEPEVVEDKPEIILSQSTLEDGTIVYYDGELGAEVAVFTDEAMEILIEDGDYVLENGDTFSVVNGVISVYTPIVVDETPEVVPEEEALEEVNFEEKYNEIKVIVDELKEKLEMFNKQEVKLKAEIEKLNAEPEVESITQKPTETRELTQLEKRLEHLDSLRKLVNKK